MNNDHNQTNNHLLSPVSPQEEPAASMNSFAEPSIKPEGKKSTPDRIVLNQPATFTSISNSPPNPSHPSQPHLNPPKSPGSSPQPITSNLSTTVPNSSPKSNKLAFRKKLPLIASGLILLLLIVGGTSAYYLSTRSTENRTAASGCCNDNCVCACWGNGTDKNWYCSSCWNGGGVGYYDPATDSCQTGSGNSGGGGGSGGGGSTSGLPDDQSSGCCSSDSQCQKWFGPASTCTNSNGACASGTQCQGGGCGETCSQTDCGRVICQGTPYEQTCNAGCQSPCGDGVCGQYEDYTSCPNDCSPPPAAGGLENCTPGLVYCNRDYPGTCPDRSNPMVGGICGEDSKINLSTCVRRDACAPEVSGSCEGKVRLSCGEPSQGGFVGCQGNLNCFCGTPDASYTYTPEKPYACDPAPGYVYSAADGNVRCIADVNNDSCGDATASPPPDTPPSTVVTYYCNANCDTNFQCQTVNPNYICSNGRCRHQEYPNQEDCNPPVSPFSCNTTCTQDSQCQSANPDYICYTSSNTCRHKDYPDSDTCIPPEDNAFVCLDLSSDLSNPQIGDTISLTCQTGGGGASLVNRFEFRYSVNGSTYQEIGISTKAINSLTSQPVTLVITEPGQYEIQCRACQDTNCTPWGQAQL